MRFHINFPPHFHDFRHFCGVCTTVQTLREPRCTKERSKLSSRLRFGAKVLFKSALWVHVSMPFPAWGASCPDFSGGYFPHRFRARFFYELEAFLVPFWKAFVMFLHAQSEKGKTCLDCTGVGRKHVWPSREAPIFLFFPFFLRGPLQDLLWAPF